MSESTDSDGAVLDLGCGDGHLLQLLVERGLPGSRLVGVDMSSHELALAGRRAALEQASLIRARTQALPVADGSARVVVSHLAFMLMSDLEAVVREIARVLSPGGVFATIIGGGPRVGDAFELFLDELQPIYNRLQAVPRIGHRRLRSDEGIRGLLCAATGFADAPIIEDFHVHRHDDFEALWASLGTIYEMHGLPASDTAALREGFRARASSLMCDDGTIPCGMAMRLVRCRRNFDGTVECLSTASRKFV